MFVVLFYCLYILYVYKLKKDNFFFFIKNENFMKVNSYDKYVCVNIVKLLC